MATKTQTISQQLSDHEERLRALETHVDSAPLTPTPPTKPWWLSKGVMGPLTSGIATVALCVGYIAGWPANAMAILASIAGGGSVTGIIGRLTAKVGVR